MKLEIKLPVLVKVDDYHSSDFLDEIFNEIDKRIEVKEIGFLNRKYILMIYSGDINNDENKSLIDKVKEYEADE